MKLHNKMHNETKNNIKKQHNGSKQNNKAQ